MDKITIKVINKGKQSLPIYATPQSAGMDLRADIEEKYILQPLERHLFSTGLHIQLPTGYEAMVRPRSGMALKHGVTVLNTPGCVDADYTGNIGVILVNLSQEPFTIEPGDRIAQLIINPIVQGVFAEVDVLEETERSENGFGHTGNK